MSSGSSSRPPRRDDSRRPSGRSSGPGRSSAKSSGSGSRSGSDRSGGGAVAVEWSRDGRSSGRPDSRGGRGRPDARPGVRRDGRRARPQTEAERRSLEVKSRRLPREPRDPDLERQRIEERTTEQWIDEGSVRRAATGATRRAASSATEDAPPRRAPKPLDPEVSAELVEALGQQRGARLSERLAQASEALDRERFQESRRIATAIAKEAPGVSAAHEIVGLSCYRLGMYKNPLFAVFVIIRVIRCEKKELVS